MKVIITGASGPVGEGVLLVSLGNPAVSEILAVTRQPLLRTHERLKELILNDFSEIEHYAELLKTYDACFFYAGVSSVGENEESFTKKTFYFVVPFAETLFRIHPGMTFIYVSGNRTDSTEKGKVMWARIKGRTENALLKLPFKAVYMFRPGFMKPVKGQKSVRFIYRIFELFYPLWLLLFPAWACTMQQVGQAMIRCVSLGYLKPVLEVEDIKIQATS